MISRICPVFLILALLSGGQFFGAPALAQQQGGPTALDTAIAQRKAYLTYQYGVALYKAGRYGQAVKYFQSAVRLDPDNARYRKDLAIARRQLRIEMIKRRRAAIEHEQMRREAEARAVRNGVDAAMEETEDALTSTASPADGDPVRALEAESESQDSEPAGIDSAASDLPFADTGTLGIPLLGVPSAEPEATPEPAPATEPETPQSARSARPKPAPGGDMFDDVLGPARTPHPGVVSPALP